jgi:cytochrome c553
MFTRCVSTIATITAAAALVATLNAPAQAQGTQGAGIEGKAQACAVCHGANGVPIDPKTMPIISGQQSYYIFKQLVNYRNGMREHPVMTPLAKGLQQSDLRPLADHFAAKPWPANTAAAASAAPPKGITMCTPCHQQNFQGGISWPRLAGLSYEYLVASMRAFANEQRTNNTDMVQLMKLFTDSEREAMARYLAGL